MWKSVARQTVAVLLAVGMAASAAWAQQGRTELRGRVTDAQGGVLPGVTITLTNQDDGTFREVITGADGSFFAAQLLPGVFTIRARLEGFRPFERRDYRLRVGQTLDLNIVLEIGGLAESVTVSGQSPLVDLTSAEVGGTVSADELVDLPLVNRSAFAAISLLPGLQFEPSASQGNDTIIANGQTTAASSLSVDGGANEDSTSGGAGGSQVKVAIESVAEFQVISNQFDAEFGRSSGAIVNAVTKRGTNRFSGALFSYNTSSAMKAKDFFVSQRELDKPESNHFEFGGVLGGPIVRDRMHFFSSVERRITNPARTRLFNTRPDLNRTSTEKWRAWNTMLRLDHQINNNNSWAVRWMRELSPESNTVGGFQTLNATQDIHDNEQLAVGTYTSILSNNVVNTVQVVLTDESYNYGNPCWRTMNGGELRNGQMRNCPPSMVHNSFRDNQAPWAGGRDDRHWQFNNTMSWYVPDKLGSHDFKFGATYHRSYIDDFVEDMLGGEFRMASDKAFNIDDLTTYPDRLTIRVGNPRGGVFKYPYSYWEAFFQDKWQLTNRWTVGLGVRYDAEMLGAERSDNPLLDPGTDPRDWNNVSPRTSIAYDVQGDGRSVLRAG